MSEPVVVTTDSFKQDVLCADRPVLVDFWAEWCGPCRRLTPIVEEIAAETDAVKVCKINVDDNPQLAGLYHVGAIPTLMLFQAGSRVATSTGARDKQTILRMIGLENGEERA